MEIKPVIQEIRSGLTGQYEADVLYLQRMAETYKHHPQSRELLREIGNMIMECLPAEMRARLSQKISDEEQDIQQKLSDAIRLVSQGDYEGAKRLAEGAVNHIARSLKSDQDDEYFSFHSTLEILLYKEQYKPKKSIRQTTHDNSMIYRVYGVVLREMKLYDAAAQALEESLLWNPLDIESLFELGETYKQLEELDKFRDVTMRALDCAASSGDLARCYRNLGYYYVDMQDYDTAIGLYFLSNSFEVNQMASSELQYIAQKLDKQLTPPDTKQLAQQLSDKGIRIGAHEAVIGLAVALAEREKVNNDYKSAKSYYTLVYDLTGDERVKQMMEQL